MRCFLTKLSIYLAVQVALPSLYTWIWAAAVA